MGIIASTHIAAGEILSTSNVDFAFPARGIPVENWGIVEGWIVRNDVSRGEVINWNNVEPQPAKTTSI